MGERTDIERVLRSTRWANFLESTAIGLHIHLTVLTTSDMLQIQAPSKCPKCGEIPSPLSASDTAFILENVKGQEKLELLTEEGPAACVFPLNKEIYLVARELTCCFGLPTQIWSERMEIGLQLLQNFLNTLDAGFEAGQSAAEISTLRQMNHIIISLFQGDPQAVKKALDLVLSALIILLDAKGSWLEYQDGTGLIQLSKQDIGGHIAGSEGAAEDVSEFVAEFKSDFVSGRLGVILPEAAARAVEFVPLLAQECLIVLEIQNLFKLLKDQVSGILNSVGTAVILFDDRLDFSFINNAAGKLLGDSPLNLLGLPVTTVQGPWVTRLLARPVRELRGVMDRMGEGSNQRWIDWRISPLRDRIVYKGWVVMIEDRTEFQRWQEVGRQAERLATTATMVGSLAHELRNPLGSAKAILQLMSRKQDQDNAAGYTDLILRELDRVTRLLNEFLLLGKPADLEKEPVALDKFLRELREIFEAETLDTKINLKFDLGEVPPVYIDPGQLTQVMLNLVRNAIQAVGEDEGLVTISLICDDDWVKLAVKDTGPGISPIVMDNLFKPFYTTKERGAGLGLPVCQAIINNHGGQLLPENAPEGGAIFTVCLPVPYTAVDSPKNVDVLISVSDTTVRCPCENALRTSGFRTLSVQDPSEGLPFGMCCQPRVIIIDEAGLNKLSISKIREQWSESALVLISSSPERLHLNDVQIIKRPVDFGRLMTLIASLTAKT